MTCLAAGTNLKIVEPPPAGEKTEETFLGFTITREVAANGSIYGKATRVKTGKEGWHFRFRSVEQREAKIAEFKSDEKAKVKARADKVAANRTARQGFVNPYKPADVFCYSWGYDQTNVEWFQCVGVGPRSVILRPIDGTLTTREGYSDMSGWTEPKPGEFTGQPFRVNIQIRDGSHWLPAAHGNYNAWDGKQKYVSWYA
jgi:hypothetical protein